MATSKSHQFIRPKKGFSYYLLMLIRIVAGLFSLVLFMVFSLAMKSYIVLITLITMAIGFGVIKLIETYAWKDIQKSPVMFIFALSIIGLWILVAMAVGGMAIWTGKVTGLSNKFKTLGEGMGTLWEKLTDFVFNENHKKKYRVIYGDDFPEPKYEDFGFKEEDYFSYNRRFSIDEWKFIISIFIGLGGGALALYLVNGSLTVKNKPEYIPMAVFFVVAIISGVATKKFDTWLAKRFPQHEKVQRYEYAKEIYGSIKEQVRSEQFNREWEAKQKAKKLAK